jgi:hypothetical protein
VHNNFGMHFLRNMQFLLLLTIVLLSTSACEQEEIVSNKTMQLIFQEFRFNDPVDNFLILKFNPTTGLLTKLKNANYSRVIESGDVYTINNIVEKGFILQRGESCDVFYMKKGESNTYLTYVIEKVTSEVIAEFPKIINGGIYDGYIYYVEGMTLKRLSLYDREIMAIEGQVSAIVVTKNIFIKFYTDGRIVVNSDDEGQIIGKYKGIVTEAGYISDDWIWYYLRKNEKSQGDLWFLNVSSQKRFKSSVDLPQVRMGYIIRGVPGEGEVKS